MTLQVAIAQSGPPDRDLRPSAVASGITRTFGRLPPTALLLLSILSVALGSALATFLIGSTKMRRMFRRLPWVMASIFAVSTLAAEPGRADKVLPDPPQCGAQDEGQVYLSIFHDVFRLPYLAIKEIRTIPLEAGGDLLPYPPNPLVPSGCYANP